MTEENIELKDEERQPCEIWTRVMGYFRSVNDFNIGKKTRICGSCLFFRKENDETNQRLTF